MNLVRLENRLLVSAATIGVPVYDFDFALYFTCTHPYEPNPGERCVLRTGQIQDYEKTYNDYASNNLRLVNTPADYKMASELEAWYPLISDMTPRTHLFDQLPTAEQIEAEFEWPIFLKGSRQTNRHIAELSVVQNREQYERVADAYRAHPILNWQKPAVREFVPLMPVEGEIPGVIKPSVEYRSFWWFGRCVGCGRYWHMAPAYDCRDLQAGLDLAREAAARVNVPFLVVDFAKTLGADWIVIECNDAQESGYAAMPPQLLWRNILDLM
ncbi:MAG: ATP-grasp domain-containing protein [Candidatus Sumerlaeia bacterium]